MGVTQENHHLFRNKNGSKSFIHVRILSGLGISRTGVPHTQIVHGLGGGLASSRKVRDLGLRVWVHIDKIFSLKIHVLALL